MKAYLLILSIFLISCSSWNAQDDTLYTIQVELINGNIRTLHYKLPYNSKFSIHSQQGSYFLIYKVDDLPFYYTNTCGKLKTGAVDYKILKKERVEIVKSEKLELK